MDVDIDFLNRQQILDLIKHIPASIKDGKRYKKHNTGVYCQEIPFNPLIGAASIDYKEAEQRGYFKIDFLNVNIYNGVKDEAHLIKLLNIEPLWNLLEQKDFTDMLFQIKGYHKLCQRMKPQSIPQLAAVLAIMRPAKRHLLGKSWDVVNNEVWDKEDNEEYAFKKSHAHGYASAIVVQMKLLTARMS